MRVLERHPHIDLLVNNAGIAGREEFLGASPELIEKLIATNYLGSVWCLRAFLPGLGVGSHVVNVVSIAGLVAVGPYSASKHAQLAFSRSTAVELGRNGISVHTSTRGSSRRRASRSDNRLGRFHRLVASPELVAERIVGAVEHDRREILVPRWYRPAALAQAVAAGRPRSRLGALRPPPLLESRDPRLRARAGSPGAGRWRRARAAERRAARRCRGRPRRGRRPSAAPSPSPGTRRRSPRARRRCPAVASDGAP